MCAFLSSSTWPLKRSLSGGSCTKMFGAREETWTARESQPTQPSLLTEQGWSSFVEWSPNRKDPLHCLVAVLCLFSDKDKASALLECGGVQEPLRTVLSAIAKGEDASACVVEAWEYASPEDKVGYDMGDVVSQLHRLGTDAQDHERGYAHAHTEALYRRVATGAGELLTTAKQAQPDRLRMRIDQAAGRLTRWLAGIDALTLAYADARYLSYEYADDEMDAVIAIKMGRHTEQ